MTTAQLLDGWRKSGRTFANDGEVVRAIYDQHKADGESEHGASFVGCYCQHCRAAREKDPSLYNRPKCATCGAEKKWFGEEARYYCETHG